MVSKVVKVDTSASVLETVSKMIKTGVGSVVVLEKEEGGGKIAGIVTKGDVLRRGILRGLDLKTTPVTKIMSRKVTTIVKDASLEEASRLMSERNVSKLPVVDHDAMVGIITSSDIIRTEPVMVSYLHELVKARFVPHELA
jgi:CBS domain-containing protein